MVYLAGSLKDTAPLKWCWSCEKNKSQAGGVLLGRERWVCYDCWKGKYRAATT
jgi:hypothetical protein